MAVQSVFRAVLLLGLMASDMATAQSVPSSHVAETQNAPGPLGAFLPPTDDGFDWVQLVSGEWLKGEIRDLRSYTLEFDSDNLDLLSLDWDDVRQVRSAKPQSVFIEKNDGSSDPFTLIGVFRMTDDTVTITTDTGVQAFHKDEIVSIADGSGHERGLWSGKLTLGANIRRGNSDLVDWSSNMYASRRTAESRYYVSYVANVSLLDDVETSNNHRWTSFFDVFSSRKVFWRTLTGEYYQDSFKNIDYQWSLGSGLGYQLIKTKKTEWIVLTGIGGLAKRYVSVTPGQEIEQSSPLFVLGTKLDMEVTNRIDYLFDFSAQFVDEASGQYIHHLSSTLSIDLIKNLDLNLTFVWDNLRRPQVKADGTSPTRNDYQLIVGISLEL